MANVLPQLGLTSQNQDDILAAIESGNVPITDIISDIIEGQAYRDKITAGLYQRYVGKPADSFEHSDPRMANGVPIYARDKISGQVNHKLHFAFDRLIAINKASYAASNISITFDDKVIGAQADKIKAAYEEIQDMNALQAVLNDCMVACADRGTSYFVLYSEDGKIKITKDNEWETVVIYDSMTGKPAYALRYQLYRVTEFLNGYRIPDRPDTTEYQCEWYDGVNVSYYSGQLNGLQEDTRDGQHITPHMFGTEERPGLPIIELPNNADKVGDVEQTISLQDAYDIAISDLSSEVTAMRLAYLILRMMGQNIDVEFKKRLEDTGILPIDSELGSAEFLQKNLDTTAIRDLRDTLKEGIYKFSFSYDPDDIAAGSPTAFQIRQKLAGLEQSASQTLNFWDHQLDYLDYILQTYFMTFRNIAEYDLSGIKRNYVRNVPRDRNQELLEVRNAGGQLSNDYVIRLSTLSLDVDLEQNDEEITEEREALMQPVGFGTDMPASPDQPEEMAIEGEGQAVPDAVNVSATAGQVGESSNLVQLNGAQVASATDIVKLVGTGELSLEAAVNLLHVLFNLEMDQAESLVIGMEEIARGNNGEQARPDTQE